MSQATIDVPRAIDSMNRYPFKFVHPMRMRRLRQEAERVLLPQLASNGNQSSNQSSKGEFTLETLSRTLNLPMPGEMVPRHPIEQEENVSSKPSSARTSRRPSMKTTRMLRASEPAPFVPKWDFTAYLSHLSTAERTKKQTLFKQRKKNGSLSSRTSSKSTLKLSSKKSKSLIDGPQKRPFFAPRPPRFVSDESPKTNTNNNTLRSKKKDAEWTKGMDSPLTQVTLQMSCENLPEEVSSNCIVVLSVKEDGHFQWVANTEISNDVPHPSFETPFVLDHWNGEDMHLHFSVYHVLDDVRNAQVDFNDIVKKKLVGTATVQISDIVATDHVDFPMLDQTRKPIKHALFVVKSFTKDETDMGEVKEIEIDTFCSGVKVSSRSTSSTSSSGKRVRPEVLMTVSVRNPNTNLFAFVSASPVLNYLPDYNAYNGKFTIRYYSNEDPELQFGVYAADSFGEIKSSSKWGKPNIPSRALKGRIAVRVSQLTASSKEDRPIEVHFKQYKSGKPVIPRKHTRSVTDAVMTFKVFAEEEEEEGEEKEEVKAIEYKEEPEPESEQKEEDDLGKETFLTQQEDADTVEEEEEKEKEESEPVVEPVEEAKEAIKDEATKEDKDNEDKDTEETKVEKDQEEVPVDEEVKEEAKIDEKEEEKRGKTEVNEETDAQEKETEAVDVNQTDESVPESI